MSTKIAGIPLFPYEQQMLAQLNTENYNSLVDVFEQACRDFSDRIAYTAMGQDISVLEIDGKSAAFAAYQLKDCGLDADTLRAFCREQLTAYKVPRTIEFQKELPKSNVGKILRRELRD